MSDASSFPPVKKREIVSWAMFDFANSSYTTIIVSVAYSIYFTKLVAPGRHADFLWGVGIFLSNLLVMFTAPIIGAMADDMGRKKLFLLCTSALCVAGTLALATVAPGWVVWGLTLFVISNLGFSYGENLVAAFLPEISTPQNVGRISGFGWGLGYFGGLVCLMAVRPLLNAGFTTENLSNLRLIWIVTGLFFLVSAIPTFLILRERAPRGPRRKFGEYFKVTFGRLRATAGALRHFSELARFLTVFFIFSCGLMQIIAFAGIYAERTIGYTPDQLIGLFISLQLSSAGGAFLFGFVQDRLGARRTIQMALVVWILVCVGAYAAQTKGFFFVVALAAGLGIGSLQSASRGLVGLFSPVEKAASFLPSGASPARAPTCSGR
ncbi:MAG: MFS transporter [Thermoanaerobaculia bacterium]|nr:MFS transporter [Thermoanaerobaculia bacterium]